MSDILDVMNIKSFPKKKKAEKESTSDQATLHEQRQIYAPEEYASANKKRKLSAMNRELYNLIGSNVPPMAIDVDSVAKNLNGKKFKQRIVTNKKNVPWRRLGFKNPARDDDLVLYHWTKAVIPKSVSSEPIAKEENKEERETEDSKEEDSGEEEKKAEEQKEEENKEDEKKEGAAEQEKVAELDPNEYRYAKYNTRLPIPEFSKAEYEEATRLEEARLKKEEEARVAREKSKQEAREMKIKREKEEVEAKQAKKDQFKKKKAVEETAEKEKDKALNETEASSEKSESIEKSQSIEVDSKNEMLENSVQGNSVKIESSKPEEKNNVDSNPEEKTIEEKKGSGSAEDKKGIVNKKVRPWEYEETKLLFDLCSTYDMRWAVIYDRYQDMYEDRKIEDLKVQMYGISAAILEKRGNPNDAALIKALRSFDKEKEVMRKFYLNKLIHRAPTEIAEEESLVIEARKFELAAKKMLYERGQLLQLLDSPQSSASVQQYLTSQGLTQLYNSLMSSDKSRKRKAEVPVAPLLGPNAIPHTQHIMMSNAQNNNASMSASSAAASGINMKDNKRRQAKQQPSVPASSNISTPVTKNVSKLSEVQQLLQKALSAEELEVYGIEIHTDRIQPGVHVRSQKIASFKPSVQAKVHEILGQLGLSIKPNLPTGPVSKKFDELLYKISHLVDLKKQSDKLVAEIELVKRQKGLS